MTNPLIEKAFSIVDEQKLQIANAVLERYNKHQVDVREQVLHLRRFWFPNLFTDAELITALTAPPKVTVFYGVFSGQYSTMCRIIVNDTRPLVTLEFLDVAEPRIIRQKRWLFSAKSTSVPAQLTNLSVAVDGYRRSNETEVFEYIRREYGKGR